MRGLLLTFPLAGCNASLGAYADDKTTPPPDATLSDATDADTDADADSDTDADADADTEPTDGPRPTADTAAPPTGDTGEPPPPPWRNGDPLSAPTVTAAPPDLATTCVDAGMIPAPIVDDYVDNEVVVDAFDDVSDFQTMNVTVAGWYHLYNDPPANDGAAQWNESIIIRITNPTFPTGSTVLANCDVDWVTVDGDNVVPVPLAQYLGTFWFDAGANTIEVAHFCPIVNLGLCTALENTDDAGSLCGSSDNNRLRMVSDGLCIAEP